MAEVSLVRDLGIGAASPRKSPTVEEAGEKFVSLNEWIFGPPSPEPSHIDAPPSPKKGYTVATDGSNKSIGDDVIPSPNMQNRTVIHGANTEKGTVIQGPNTEKRTVINGPNTEKRTITQGPNTDKRTVIHGSNTQKMTISSSPNKKMSIISPSKERTVTPGSTKDRKTATPTIKERLKTPTKTGRMDTPSKLKNSIVPYLAPNQENNRCVPKRGPVVKLNFDLPSELCPPSRPSLPTGSAIPDRGNFSETTPFKSGDGGDSKSTGLANWTKNGNSSKNATPQKSGDGGQTILNIMSNVAPRCLWVTIVNADDGNRYVIT